MFASAIFSHKHKLSWPSINGVTAEVDVNLRKETWIKWFTRNVARSSEQGFTVFNIFCFLSTQDYEEGYYSEGS
jgi:hypothetical protein